MKRGDIYLVSLDPIAGHEQSGTRPIVIISPESFNKRTQTPLVCPITNGGEFARRNGFAVPISGIRTTDIVRCDQLRTLDINARKGRKIDVLPFEIMEDVLARVVTLFE